MGMPNPIFKKNYEDYLLQLKNVDFALCNSTLGINVDEKNLYAEIPFLNTIYRVSRLGVVDEQGKRPKYGICVILLKYLLMCPQWVPPATDWIPYRDFKDSGQSQDNGLADYATMAITKHYTGKLSRLRATVAALGGTPPEIEYPYDFSAVIPTLPRIPILFLFNDADGQFSAKTSILYQRRAEHFLDAECRVMVDGFLLEHLKKGEHMQTGN